MGNAKLAEVGRICLWRAEQTAVADLLASKGSQINDIISTPYNPAVAAATAGKDPKLVIKLVATDDDAERDAKSVDLAKDFDSKYLSCK